MTPRVTEHTTCPATDRRCGFESDCRGLRACKRNGQPIESVEALRQQLHGAVEAFERYARHDEGCAGDAICSCGLTVIRAALRVGGTVNPRSQS